MLPASSSRSRSSSECNKKSRSASLSSAIVFLVSYGACSAHDCLVFWRCGQTRNSRPPAKREEESEESEQYGNCRQDPGHEADTGVGRREQDALAVPRDVVVADL